MRSIPSQICFKLQEDMNVSGNCSTENTILPLATLQTSQFESAVDEPKKKTGNNNPQSEILKENYNELESTSSL